MILDDYIISNAAMKHSIIMNTDEFSSDGSNQINMLS